MIILTLRKLKMSRLVNFNGKLIPENEAKISIYDSALMFGDMVFEMTRSFNKKQFKLEEHVDRLLAGIKVLRIPLKEDKKMILNRCHETIEANEEFFNDDDEHRLMIDVSRGLLGIYEDVEGLQKGPNLIIADFPLKWTVSGMSEYFNKGIHAVISNQKMIPDDLLNAAVKNRSRLHYMMANIDVSKMNLERAWALLEDPEGNICEGTGSNVFFVKDQELFTPKPKNMLRGISRQYLIELAKDNGIKVFEEDITKEDIPNFTEAFFTATPFCMIPCYKINDHKLEFRKKDSIYNYLLDKWSLSVDIEIESQIKSWNAGKSYLGKNSTPYSFKN